MADGGRRSVLAFGARVGAETDQATRAAHVIDTTTGDIDQRGGNSIARGIASARSASSKSP
jgi:hypothetical protein